MFTCNYLTISKLSSTIGQTTILHKSKNIKIFQINGVKTDLVNYQYPWLKKPIHSSNINIASIEDIAAMKLSAITCRGTKKDFIDLFFLLKKYSLKELLSMYATKYNDGSEFLVIKSLTYFNDAEDNEDCQMFIQTNWEEVKTVITKIVQDYIKHYPV